MESALTYVAIIVGTKVLDLVVSEGIKRSKRTKKTKVDDYIFAFLDIVSKALNFVIPRKLKK